MERLQVVGIESAYGKNRVLRGVSFCAGAGQCVGVVGVNGCGKSTLLQILSGLRRADAGDIWLAGHPAKQADFICDVGYVPQECNLIEELTVQDNLRLWNQNWLQGRKVAGDNGFPGTEGIVFSILQEEIRHMLGGDILKKKAGRLSGGMKKRVSIACVLLGNPSVLLLDEPEAALDLSGRMELRSYLHRYKESGGTLVLATHEESWLELCDRIVVLENGVSREIDSTLRGEALFRIITGTVTKAEA